MEPTMRKPFSPQQRLDGGNILDVELNLECRDEMIPILRALQHIYGRPELRDEILQLVADDVNADSHDDRGRTGLDYWQIIVLAAVRLGCELTYDRLQDLAEQHWALRQIMGIGQWADQVSFNWRRIRDNLCLLKPETIEKISHLLVAEGHRIVPQAAETSRADSFVEQTPIHHSSESTLIRDGIRKIIEICVLLAKSLGVRGWRQHKHLLKRIKRCSRRIERIAAKKGPNYKERIKKEYEELLELSGTILRRANELCDLAELSVTTFCSFMREFSPVEVYAGEIKLPPLRRSGETGDGVGSEHRFRRDQRGDSDFTMAFDPATPDVLGSVGDQFGRFAGRA